MLVISEHLISDASPVKATMEIKQRLGRTQNLYSIEI